MTESQRSQVERVRALRRDPALRRSQSVLLAEGLHLAREALAHAAAVELAVAAPELDDAPEGRALRAALDAAGVPILTVSARVLEGLQDARAPQPILVVARYREATVDAVASPGRTPLIVVACGIQDPGNLGAILRTAHAAGATGALLVGECADLTHPRTVRASAGACFRLPAARAAAADVLGLRHGGTRLVAADPRGGVPCERVDFRAATALVLGSEGAGIPADLLAAAAVRAAIPMEPGVESLSVGAAAAVLLFEARRQRATR